MAAGIRQQHIMHFPAYVILQLLLMLQPRRGQQWSPYTAALFAWFCICAHKHNCSNIWVKPNSTEIYCSNEQPKEQEPHKDTAPNHAGATRVTLYLSMGICAQTFLFVTKDYNFLSWLMLSQKLGIYSEAVSFLLFFYSFPSLAPLHIYPHAL